MTQESPFFATTRWSLVAAASTPDALDARLALGELCEHCWYPLYAFLRRRGHAVDDAQDLTQGFFADLLERGDLMRATPERGRFRSFLLGALRNYVAVQRRNECAQKRGGGQLPHSFSWSDAEERFALEPADQRTPESVFEANWARALLAQVMGRLESEYAKRDKSGLFEQLAPCLGGAPEGLPYAQIADALGASEGAVKVAVHRLRARFRQLLQAEIRETLPVDGDVEAEIRHLFAALG